MISRGPSLRSFSQTLTAITDTTPCTLSVSSCEAPRPATLGRAVNTTSQNFLSNPESISTEAVGPSPQSTRNDTASNIIFPDSPLVSDIVSVPNVLFEAQSAGHNIVRNSSVANNMTVIGHTSTKAQIYYPLSHPFWQRPDGDQTGDIPVLLKYETAPSQQKISAGLLHSYGAIKLTSYPVSERLVSGVEAIIWELGMVEQSTTNAFVPLLVKGVIQLAALVNKSARDLPSLMIAPLELLVFAKKEHAEFLARYLELFDLALTQPTSEFQRGALPQANPVSSFVGGSEESVQHTRVDDDPYQPSMYQSNTDSGRRSQGVQASEDTLPQMSNTSTQTDTEVGGVSKPAEDDLRAALADAEQRAAEAHAELAAARRLLHDRNTERADLLKAVNVRNEQKKASARLWQEQLDRFDDEYPSLGEAVDIMAVDWPEVPLFVPPNTHNG